MTFLDRLFGSAPAKEIVVEKKIVIDGKPLTEVSCDVLRSEIARRREDDRKRKLAEATRKADEFDKIVDNLLEIVGPEKSKVSYTDELANAIWVRFGNSIRYGTENRYYDQSTCMNDAKFDIAAIVESIEESPEHMCKLLNHIKATQRQMFVNQIVPECT